MSAGAKKRTIMVVATTPSGKNYVIFPDPNTIDHVAEVMGRITYGTSANASFFLHCCGSYSADGHSGIRYRAEVLPDRNKSNQKL